MMMNGKMFPRFIVYTHLSLSGWDDVVQRIYLYLPWYYVITQPAIPRCPTYISYTPRTPTPSTRPPLRIAPGPDVEGGREGRVER